MNIFQDYIDYIRNHHNKAAEITISKAQDYAGSDEPMRNFIDSAMMAGVTVEQGILVRMCDKIARARSLTERASLGGSVGEKLADTMMDLGNYGAILAYWCENNYNSEEVNQLKLQFEEPEPAKSEPSAEHKSIDNKSWFENLFG